LTIVAALAGSAFAQAPTLTINGVTSSTNGAQVDVPFGSRIVIEIADVTAPNGNYAFLGALNHNSKSTGFWLSQQTVPPFIKPWTLLTGIPTADIEAKYSVDIFPDTKGSPNVRLDSSGKALLVYTVPSFSSSTPPFSVFMQAVTRDSQNVLDVSNGLELKLHAASINASYTLARGADQDTFAIGSLSFQTDPSAATYSQLFAGPFDVLVISASGFFPLIKNEAIDDSLNLTSFESFGRNKVGRYRENPDFNRIWIPAVTSDGKTIPARDLYRIRDKGSLLSGFMIVNQGENPNTPGQKVFFPVGSMRQDPNDPTNINYYQRDVLIGWDGVHACVATTDTNADPKLQVPHVFIMAIDGTTPYTDSLGAPTAMMEVTPQHDPPFPTIPLNAAIGCKNRIYFFGSESVNFTDFGNKSLYWVPLAGGAPTLVQVDPIRFNNLQFRAMDEDSELVSDDGSVGVFVGQYDNKTEDYFAVNSVSNPNRAVNISGWRAQTKIAQAGQATDGTSYCNISPGGKWLAYCTDKSGPDDLFLAATDGSSAENNKRLSNAFGGQANDCRDPNFVDENNLVFFYGNDQGSVFAMDLYRYEIAADRFTNLTKTSGEISPPYTALGKVHSRGEFFSDSRRFLYFLRDAATTKGGRDAANVVGLDTTTWTVFDLTGSEFSGGFVPDVNGSVDGSQNNSQAFTWGFMRGGGPLKNIIFFKAYFADADIKVDQLFLFDMENPFAALPLTAFIDDSLFIRNITPTVFGPFAAFSSGIGIDQSFQKLYMIDVSHLSLKVLDTNLAVQNGSFAWLPPIVQGPTATPGSLSWVVGVDPPVNPFTGVQMRFLDLEPGAAIKTFTIVGGSELDHVIEVHR
jgi:hypothetical protein